MNGIAIRQKVAERKTRKNDQKNEHEIGQKRHRVRDDGNYVGHGGNILAELQHLGPCDDAVDGKDTGEPAQNVTKIRCRNTITYWRIQNAGCSNLQTREQRPGHDENDWGEARI